MKAVAPLSYVHYKVHVFSMYHARNPAMARRQILFNEALSLIESLNSTDMFRNSESKFLRSGGYYGEIPLSIEW